MRNEPQQDYNRRDNLTVKQDARGEQFRYRYDAANRLTGIDYSDGQIVFTYDQGAHALGRLSTVRDGAGQTELGYDPLGRITTKTQTLSYAGQTLTPLSLQADYDLGSGQLATLTLPSGHRLDYQYRADGTLRSIALDGQVIVRDIAHVPFGAVQTWSTAGGLTYRRTVDADGRIAAYSLPDTEPVLGYDLAGRIERLRDASGHSDWDFGYDALDRLESASNRAAEGPLADHRLAWTYDATGNRDSETRDGTLTDYQIDPASNRLVQVGAQVRGYDAAGNTRTLATRSLHYSGRGRLTEVRDGPQTRATYAYNAFGERVLKAVVGATRQFLYDEQGHLLGEYDQHGQLIAEHIWLDDTPVAVLVPATEHPGGEPFGEAALFYVWPDHLDTPRAISDAAGTTVWRWASAPFGETSAQEDADGDGRRFGYDLRFPGQSFDAETGLHYNYFRDYEPGTGRYVQSDPTGLDGGLNTYLYADANPLLYMDPLGLHKGDKWYGFKNREFQRWFHRCWKQPGNPDADKEEIAEAYAEWVSRGSPKGGKCGDAPPPPPAPAGACGDSCGEEVAIVVVAGGTAYVVYRCIRMIPSLFPPLWATIPANAVVP